MEAIQRRRQQADIAIQSSCALGLGAIAALALSQLGIVKKILPKRAQLSLEIASILSGSAACGCALTAAQLIVDEGPVVWRDDQGRVVIVPLGELPPGHSVNEMRRHLRNEQTLALDSVAEIPQEHLLIWDRYGFDMGEVRRFRASNHPIWGSFGGKVRHPYLGHNLSLLERHRIDARLMGWQEAIRAAPPAAV